MSDGGVGGDQQIQLLQQIGGVREIGQVGAGVLQEMAEFGGADVFARLTVCREKSINPGMSKSGARSSRAKDRIRSF